MLTPAGMTNFSRATRDDQRTMFWTLARMQVELAGYLQKLPSEPGEQVVHDYVARKVQVYIGRLIRELDELHEVNA